MAFTASGVFREWFRSTQGQGQTAVALPATYGGLGADTVKAALMNNTGTPDKDAALTATGYNTGQWTAATNEVTSGAEWVATGRALASKTLTTPSTTVFMFDAADLTGTTTITISGVYGCLVYDDTITASTGGVADQGVCFNYFGGTTGVTSGTYSVIWSANGVYRVTCT